MENPRPQLLLWASPVTLSVLGPHRYVVQVDAVRQIAFDTTRGQDEATRAKLIDVFEKLLVDGMGNESFDAHRRELARYLRGIPTSTDENVVAIRPPEQVTAAAELFNASPSPEDVDWIVRRNTNYRQVIYTSKAGAHQQVAMSIKGLIPPEVHPDVDQYFLVKQGRGVAIVDTKFHDLRPGVAFWVERGTRHEIHAAQGHDELKLFVSYAPAHHPPGRLDKHNVDIIEWMESDDFKLLR